MNSIAWFIYLSNVVENLGTMLGTVLIFTLVAWAILNISVVVSEGETLEWKDYQKWWTRGLATLIFGGLLFTLLPNKNTLYAIAAAQIGERVAENETVQGIATDATKALQSWIKKQIEPEKK